MSAARTSQTWFARSIGRLIGPIRARPRGAVTLLVVMAAVMMLGMLFASPDDETSRRWEPGLGVGSDSGALGEEAAGAVSGTEGRDTVPVAQGDGPAASGASPGSAQGSGVQTGTGSEGGPRPAADPATVVKDPPRGTTEPSAPERPERLLDAEFGESMFPEAYPGLKLVVAVEGDDDEVTATYKSDGSARFDIVRITVQQTDSGDGATRVAEQTLALYGSDRTTYTWGGRDITQAIGVRSGDGQAVGFVWRQGRYCIDVTVFPPYGSDIAAGRDGALEFIGRLGY